jgi:hypothetical protein
MILTISIVKIIYSYSLRQLIDAIHMKYPEEDEML